MTMGHPLVVANDALYVFRMPALAFLMGVFIPGALSKRGYAGYVCERARLMIYLYVVWFLIEGLTEVGTNHLRNGSMDPDRLLRVWAPIAHLWFLPFLVLATATIAFVRPWEATPLRRLGAGALVLSMVLAWGWNPNLVGVRGSSLVGFVALGSVVGLVRLRRLLTQPVRRWVAAGAGAAGLFLGLAVLGPTPATTITDTSVANHLVSVAAACAGIVMLLTLAVLLQALGGVVNRLAAVGRQTLPIYLAHVGVVAGTRVVLLRAGVSEPLTIVLLCVLLGVALPLAIARWAPRSRIGWLFDTPTWFEHLHVRWPVLRLRQGRAVATAPTAQDAEDGLR